MLLEVCVDTIDGLEAAIRGGADRIELCSALALGGLSPSVGMMKVAAKKNIACFAMIRPRPGDFIYSANELDCMLRDIEVARETGLQGVVLGASMPDGQLDRSTLQKLVTHAEGMGRTLHRAFDLVPDLSDAIELAVELGFDRILTSGRAITAVNGLVDLKVAMELAAGRISIMPGSGISAETISVIMDAVRAKEVHASCSVAASGISPKILDMGFALMSGTQTSEIKVRELKSVLSR